MAEKQATRIQTSLINAAEKKVLQWLAERQPKWVTSDFLTFIGIIGSVLIAVGYILTEKSYAFLWLSSLGFVINWYGDSLDGTLARVRGTQRPIYGYYLDHTVDIINEALMFIGLGLSPLMNLPLALLIFILYLAMTLNVSINAHLKGEFKLTYLKLGPTEFRLVAILINTIYYFVRPLQDFSWSGKLFGHELTLRSFDVAGMVILAVLVLIYILTFISDAFYYARIDPLPRKED